MWDVTFKNRIDTFFYHFEQNLLLNLQTRNGDQAVGTFLVRRITLHY